MQPAYARIFGFYRTARRKDVVRDDRARWIAERVQGALLPSQVTVMRVVVREGPSRWATWEGG